MKEAGVNISQCIKYFIALWTVLYLAKISYYTWIYGNVVFTPVGDGDAVSYDGYQVWRVKLSHASELALIKRMEDNQDISVWSLLPARTDFLVKSDNRLKVHRMLKKHRLDHTVLILNVQRRIEETKTPPSDWNEKSLRLGHRMNWYTYPTLTVIDEYFENLQENYPSLVKVLVSGHSVENRTIKTIKISNGDTSNTPIFITGGQHAREWVGITSAFYIMNNIVTKFDKQPEYMRNKDWYIMPLVNPDGYEYTRTRDRLWRKNRRKNSKCIGVDINRNFPKDWEMSGITEHNPCDSTYAGAHPFSEPEAVALRNVVEKIRKNSAGGYIDLHNYGQLIIHPWSSTIEKSKHYDQLVGTGRKMKLSIANTTKLKFKVGSAPEMLYPASGSAIDWVHSRGVKLVFAIEARDTGYNGFLTPPGDIEITGKELLAAVREIANDLKPPISRADDRLEWL